MGNLQKEYFVHEKIKLVLKIFRILIIVITTMGFIRLLEKNYAQCLADILFLIAVIFGYIRLKTNHAYYKSTTRIIFFLAIIISSYVIIHQPENPIRFIWLSTVIYMVFYLFERQESIYWITAISILLSLFFMLNPQGFNITVLNFLIWIMNMIIVLMIAHWYSTIEEKSINRLLKVKDLLSKEVELKTKELEKKTRELQTLNQNLEVKIEEKIKKNQEQEKMLFRQARYAQMGEMISMIAHQWRQPLNAISASAATMQLRLDASQFDKIFFKEKTHMISESIQHLSSTIDDFRNFFKLDKKREEIIFSTIVENALKLVRTALENKDISIHTEYHSQCTIYTYPNEIIHVILNLVKNAEDALLGSHLPNPKITIRIFEKETNVLMEIEDNAGGIDEAVIDKIFDPYFTTKENNDGTGLGLYMSKIIIEDHCHGQIEVSNAAEGALFRVILPLLPYNNGENFS